MKPDILAVGKLAPVLETGLRQTYTFHERLPESDATAGSAVAKQVRGIVARASLPVSREVIASLPALEIISVFGVGYEKVDVSAARERSIVVTNTPNVLNEDVADTAMALLLCVARGIPASERFLRQGLWKPNVKFPLMRKVSGARLGIIGLGRIGSAIAHRAEGFGMAIAYSDLEPKAGVSYKYYGSTEELAAAVDFLVVVAYGGPTTRGLVNARVLKALGPKGFLINVARGSIVDEAALVEALKAGTIRGAALDVYANEPNVPTELLTMDNVVLTPHVGSATEQTRKAMADLVLANLEAYFAGRGALTPVELGQ
ncbi:MAG: 2-hydroxyacid dehydrogenase [Candidatus Sulfotelmatobacter sp.]